MIQEDKRGRRSLTVIVKLYTVADKCLILIVLRKPPLNAVVSSGVLVWALFIEFL